MTTILDSEIDSQAAFYNIAAVERDTGLSKDTLRVWERRYGFPKPQRDQHDERLYSLPDLEKLRLLRLLIDYGHRPGKIINRSTAELSQMISARTPEKSPPPELAAIIDLLLQHDVERFRNALLQALMKQGLLRFVTETVAGLNHWIGEAWLAGRIAVFDEHLYSEHIQNILRNAIIAQPGRGSGPRVLLTSLPGEKHRIGLLMVEAVLTAEGAACVALGTETPIIDIKNAVPAYRVDVVALSFSSAITQTAALAGLAELRTLLPAAVEVWGGGGALARARKAAPGVLLLRSFDDLRYALERWRVENAQR
ncbi:MAG: MerR family transcriptional regulator [Burkholderiales bacterium]|jgi:DNA-binding transcriptional MerR regulator/methylmalonyl-CoA mutase cobalamin-binding subunit|nr:MerR family transcriptional regulator [Burkholderiales bacterium]